MQKQSNNKPRPYTRKRDKQKTVIGVTGSFGSGKSTVAGIFASYGAELIDADKLAHRVIQPEARAYKRICSAFGEGFIKENKTVNREKLAKAVFRDKSLLKKLNAIIHPEVIRMIKSGIKASKAKLIILDAPLLLEAGLEEIVDKLIVVKITRQKQFERVQKRDSLSKADISRRIRCQIPLRVLERLADFVIDNSGRREETKKQVEQIMLRLSLEYFDLKNTKASEANRRRRQVWKN